MKRNKAFQLSLLFLLLFAYPLWAQTDKDQPKLWVDAVLYTHGEVVQGEKVVRPFIVKNQGNADLVIDKVEPD